MKYLHQKLNWIERNGSWNQLDLNLTQSCWTQHLLVFNVPNRA